MATCTFEQHTAHCLGITLATTERCLKAAEDRFSRAMRAATDALGEVHQERALAAQHRAEHAAAVRREGTTDGK